MLQIIDRLGTGGPALRPGHLADPELLMEIAEKIAAQQEIADDNLLQLFSRVLHDIRIGGAWKRTNSGRLHRTEEMLCRHAPLDAEGRMAILDLGASDGITTVELVRAIRRARSHSVSALLADLNVWLHRYRIGRLVEYRAADGEPVLARVGRIGLRLARHRQSGRAQRDLLSRCYLQLGRLRRAMRPDERISLISPLVARESSVTVKELNCLERSGDLVGRFCAVRASNVLNLGYFSPEQVATAVGHLHAYLHERGCLVISRNTGQPGGEVENGSVWIKRIDGLQWVEDFGHGSEVKAIVNSWRAAD